MCVCVLRVCEVSMLQGMCVMTGCAEHTMCMVVVVVWDECVNVVSCV